MMGCGSSMDTNMVTDNTATALGYFGQQGDMSSIDVVQEFVRLDKQISKMEAICPGPRMATVEAWIEHLQGKRKSLQGSSFSDEEVEQSADHEHDLHHQHHQQQQQQTQLLPNQQILTPPTNTFYGSAAKTTAAIMNGVDSDVVDISDAIPNGVGVARANYKAAKTPSQDLANLALNLGVVDNVQKASKHEDFFANLSELALQQNTIHYYGEVLEHTKVRLKVLLESYKELNELYVNHDGIIALISGGTYMTRLEESLDSQLETARDIRDKLGSALEQWRISGILLRASAHSATLALKQWSSLANIIVLKDKIHQVLQCRKTLQASLVSLECAQLALPQVEIKHISNRQIIAVKHCNTYMITDIADQARYEHTTKVITSHEANVSLASNWLHETISKTLRKDFENSQEVVEKLAKTLRDHREDMFTAARS